jgi:GntR family transcriptional regulator, transcriptional repressor for pyruvate dehydrogenase complex
MAGLQALSEADALFHQALARAGGNSLLGLCARAVHDAVIEVIEEKIAVAARRRSRWPRGEDRGGREEKIAVAAEVTVWMARSIAHHRHLLAAVRDGDGALAAHLGRQALYGYYAGHVGEGTRRLLSAALEEW